MDKQENPVVETTAAEKEMGRIEALRNEFLGGISWFYWIGGLSIVNMAFGVLANRKFIVGLGMTEFLDYFAFERTQGFSPIWFVASLAVSAMFMWFGFMGRKGKKSFILAGLAIYALDAALLVFTKDFLGVAFHAYAGFMIFKGFKALSQILSAATPEPAALDASRERVSRAD